MDDKDLFSEAFAFRTAIMKAKRDGAFDYRDRMHNFPHGCCDVNVVLRVDFLTMLTNPSGLEFFNSSWLLYIITHCLTVVGAKIPNSAATD